MKGQNLPLKDTWKLWVECLDGEDPNSILSQISFLTFDIAIFRLVLGCRQEMFRQNPDNPPTNVDFQKFLDRNFFQSQASAIRRVAGSSLDRLTGSKGTYSLYSLISDIKNRRKELNRETFLKLRNLPYDYAPIIERENIFITEQARTRKTGFRVPREFNWEVGKEAHSSFDRLCGTTSLNRQPLDIISEKVFDRLLEKIKTCKDITKYVDKYIAHSATPESRVLDHSDSEVTFKHLWDAHKTIYEVANFFSVSFLSVEKVPISEVSYEFFEKWDMPMLQGQDSNYLKSIYKQFSEETEQWRLRGVNEIWSWIER